MMPASAESKCHQRVRCYAAEVSMTRHPHQGTVERSGVAGRERVQIE